MLFRSEKDEVASSQPFSFANSCSNGNNDCDIISLQCDNDTCRVRGCTTSGRYVRILDFRHFERHMMFSQSDRKTYKKAISDGVNVSVVLDVGCGNT